MKVVLDESGFWWKWFLVKVVFGESGFWWKWFLMKVVFDENLSDEIDHFHLNFDESILNRGPLSCRLKTKNSVFFEEASPRARSSLGPWTPVAGRFCSTTRRGCRAVDARSPIGHARCESSRECPRVGEVVPSCGFHSDGVDIAVFNCRKRGEGHWGARSLPNWVK